MDVTERLLNTNIVVFLEFRWFALGFLHSDYWECLIRLKKCRTALMYFDF